MASSIVLREASESPSSVMEQGISVTKKRSADLLEAAGGDPDVDPAHEPCTPPSSTGGRTNKHAKPADSSSFASLNAPHRQFERLVAAAEADGTAVNLDACDELQLLEVRVTKVWQPPVPFRVCTSLLCWFARLPAFSSPSRRPPTFPQFLGEGISSHVYLARHTGGTLTALKLMGDDDSTNTTTFAQEVAVLEVLADAPYVVRSLWASRPDSCSMRKDGRRVHLNALEYTPHGDLMMLLLRVASSPQPVLPAHLARSYARQFLVGLAACHARHVYHRDLKPDNLLVARDGSLRLADFGISMICPRASTVVSKSGTPRYMPPEVLLLLNSGLCNLEKADIWSAGVVIFAILVGRHPMQTASMADWFFKRIAAGRWDQFWEGHMRIGADCLPCQEDRRFIERMLSPRPAQRPSIASLLQNWLSEDSCLSPMEHAEEFDILLGDLEQAELP